MPDPICPPCLEGLHKFCTIWTCACTHHGCPDQLTIDDALNPEENR